MSLRLACVVIAGIICSTPFARADEPAPPATAPSTAADQTILDRDFERTLTNATLVGHFVADEDDTPKAERYAIAKVSKLSGDRWLFAARMQFGTKDVTVPLIIPVKWAGDTPVISVTDLSIPGVGTYTARVLIYHDHYVGTWSSTRHGGTMWGRIEHAAPATAPATQPQSN